MITKALARTRGQSKLFEEKRIMGLPVIQWVFRILWLASLIHVGVESVKQQQVGRPSWHVVMVGFVAWPLGYLLWIFYWSGTLRKSKTQLESEEWVERIAR